MAFILLQQLSVVVVDVFSFIRLEIARNEIFNLIGRILKHRKSALASNSRHAAIECTLNERWFILKSKVRPSFQLTIFHARKTERFNDSRAHFDVFGLTEISPISRITFVVVVNSIEFFRNRVREQHVYFTIYISYVVWNLSHFSKWFFVHSFARSHFAIQWKLGLRAVAFICFLFMSKSLKI